MLHARHNDSVITWTKQVTFTLSSIILPEKKAALAARPLSIMFIYPHRCLNRKASMAERPLLHLLIFLFQLVYLLLSYLLGRSAAMNLQFFFWLDAAWLYVTVVRAVALLSATRSEKVAKTSDIIYQVCNKFENKHKTINRAVSQRVHGLKIVCSSDG